MLLTDQLGKPSEAEHRTPQGDRALAEAGRRQSRRHSTSERHWPTATTTSLSHCRRQASRRRRRPSAARRSRSWGRSSTTTPRSWSTGNSSPHFSGTSAVSSSSSADQPRPLTPTDGPSPSWNSWSKRIRQKDYPLTGADRWSGAGGPAGLWATPPARRPTSGMH